MAIRENFETANADALASYAGDSARRYATLKLAGLDDAPMQISVFSDVETKTGHGLGSRTMPETKAFSSVAAIQSLWLLLRAQGIGLGWVSILEAGLMHAILEVDPTWRFIGHLCIGYPTDETVVPELVRKDWQQRLPAEDLILQR